jgi:hypothetical protein
MLLPAATELTVPVDSRALIVGVTGTAAGMMYAAQGGEERMHCE